MAWKWYTITDYTASVGSAGASSYYGAIQLTGEGFYALRFWRGSAFPPVAIAAPSHRRPCVPFPPSSRLTVVL